MTNFKELHVLLRVVIVTVALLLLAALAQWLGVDIPVLPGPDPSPSPSVIPSDLPSPSPAVPSLTPSPDVS